MELAAAAAAANAPPVVGYLKLVIACPGDALGREIVSELEGRGGEAEGSYFSKQLFPSSAIFFFFFKKSCLSLVSLILFLLAFNSNFNFELKWIFIRRANTLFELSCEKNKQEEKKRISIDSLLG